MLDGEQVILAWLPATVEHKLDTISEACLLQVGLSLNKYLHWLKSSSHQTIAAVICM